MNVNRLTLSSISPKAIGAFLVLSLLLVFSVIPSYAQLDEGAVTGDA